MHTDQSGFELLFKRKEYSEGNYSFLKEITEQYPYFTPAQFFLLKETTSDTDVYTKQAAKTALLFNNSFWLNFQLRPKIEAKNINTEAPKVVEIEPVAVIEDKTEPKTMPSIPPLKLEAFDSNKHNMLFEPMHMVDYFASQGIKLSEEVLTGDKLGKQLKSFTEWLKTTKRVSTAYADTGLPGGQAENAIQNMAEKSNIEGDVVTESMAEVFAMQGKAKKAIEVYEKLSLLNPSKSAFFAAKINNLKG